ncbi:MAG: hypothetical protein WKF37_07155 [Bryobacteraceae bacterium]
MCKAALSFVLAAALLHAAKLTSDERIEILRGLTFEYATAKAPIPRSKKPLEFHSDGKFDKSHWDDAGKTLGPAARVGDLVQITKVSIEDDRLVLEINGGARGKRKWYENVEVGMGNRTRPLGNDQTAAPGGTSIALLFDNPTPAATAAELKKFLAPILDFERRSATENAVDLLPPEVKAAVIEHRAIDGMDTDQVLMALGKPRTKVRETKDGTDQEDWIYGLPPGKVTFVTFATGKVVRVKEAYAGLGGQTAPSLKPQL